MASAVLKVVSKPIWRFEIQWVDASKFQIVKGRITTNRATHITVLSPKVNVRESLLVRLPHWCRLATNLHHLELAVAYPPSWFCLQSLSHLWCCWVKICDSSCGWCLPEEAGVLPIEPSRKQRIFSVQEAIFFCQHHLVRDFVLEVRQKVCPVA